MTPDVFLDVLATGGLTVEPAALLRFAGRLHPAVVHFPIALLITAGVIEILRGFRKGGGVSPIAFPCVVLGALAAALAAWLGWVNADLEPQSRAATEMLWWHRWLGVTTAGVAAFAAGAGLLVRALERDWTRNIYRGALMLVMMLVSVGGYLGGELVHGKGYLFEVFRTTPPVTNPVSPSESQPVPPVVSIAASDPPADHRAVQGIFDARCIECHGPRKRKGMLRLDAPDQYFGDDQSIWVITPGDAAASLLYQRITLPADDPDRMPADGDPLSPEEIGTIRAWIEAGAQVVRSPARAAELPKEPAPARVAVETPAPKPIGPADPLGVKVIDERAQERAFAALRERGAVASVIAADTRAVDVNLSVLGRRAANADLALLAGLEPSLTWLNLARTGVTDDGLARLASFTALRRLRLEQCPVGDAGVAHLAALRQLEYLNLYGTEVTDEGLARLTTLPALKKLFLWQTQVTDEGVAGARAVRPDLEIVRGAAPPPVITEDEKTDAALPPCCAQARAAGGECDHACCVAAAKEGLICAKCAAPAK